MSESKILIFIFDLSYANTSHTQTVVLGPKLRHPLTGGLTVILLPVDHLPDFKCGHMRFNCILQGLNGLKVLKIKDVRLMKSLPSWFYCRIKPQVGSQSSVEGMK